MIQEMVHARDDTTGFRTGFVSHSVHTPKSDWPSRLTVSWLRPCDWLLPIAAQVAALMVPVGTLSTVAPDATSHLVSVRVPTTLTPSLGPSCSSTLTTTPKRDAPSLDCFSFSCEG